jgi:predicted dehydrogenase
LKLERDYEAVLRAPDVDAVVLATPHSQHCDQIRAAAAAGKHIFVEKPLALSLADAESAVAAAKAAGVMLCVGFNRRFLPGYKSLFKASQAGDLGRLMHVEANFSGAFGYHYTNEMWRGAGSENPAGGMAAMGIHMLDAMLSIMGPVRRVATLSRRLAVPSDLDDVTSVILDFASGATGSLATLMATGGFWRLHVFGAEGWAQMPDQNSLVLADLSGKQTAHTFEPVDTLAAELDAFAGAIRSKAKYPVSFGEALAGVATMEAIGLSARNGGAWTDVRQPV